MPLIELSSRMVHVTKKRGHKMATMRVVIAAVVLQAMISDAGTHSASASVRLAFVPSPILVHEERRLSRAAQRAFSVGAQGASRRVSLLSFPLIRPLSLPSIGARNVVLLGSLDTIAQVGNPDSGNDGGPPSTWTIRRAGEEVRQIPASNRRDPGMGRDKGRGGGVHSGRDDGGRRPRQWREPGAHNHAGPSAGRDSRRRWPQRPGRPMPQQIILNQRIVACTTVQEVFGEVALAREEGVPLNSVNLATALHRVARCGNSNIFRDLPGEPAYQFLLDEVSSRLESDDFADFKPRELANTAWGVAKAQVAAPKLFANLCRAALNVGLRHFKPQELSNCVWALSTSCNQCTAAQRAEFQAFIPLFFERVEVEIVRRSKTADARSVQPAQQQHPALPDGEQDTDTQTRIGLTDFKAQELSNTLWSFATVAGDRRDIFKVIEAEMLRRGLGAYVPQDIANSVWAFVTAGASTPEVLALVEKDVCVRGVDCFKSQELANLVWAMAKADYPMTSFLDLVEKEVLRRDLVTFMPQELSNVVWAFATAGCKGQELFKAVEREILERGPKGFKSQELANTAWAYAKTAQEAPLLFDAIEQELLTHRNLELFIPQELSNVLWSFAKLGHASPRLFKAMGNEMLRRGLGTFKTQELSNAVWAHAATGQSLTKLFVAVETEALNRGLAAFSPQDLANMIWAFGKADHVAALLFDRIAAEFDAIQAQCGSLDLFKAQELSNLLWACAKTQHTAKLLFEAAEASVREVLACIDKDGDLAPSLSPAALLHRQGAQEGEEEGAARFGAAAFRGMGAVDASASSTFLTVDNAVTAVEVSDELLRYARVGLCADQMFEKLAHEILLRDLEDFNSQHFANIAWAYVLLKFSRFHHEVHRGACILSCILSCISQVLASRPSIKHAHASTHTCIHVCTHTCMHACTHTVA